MSDQNRPSEGTKREYERSGLYPENGKPFRMWALFGWLTALIALLAVVAAVLNLLVLGVPG
jgi:hypothetical protein